MKYNNITNIFLNIHNLKQYMTFSGEVCTDLYVSTPKHSHVMLQLDRSCIPV